MDFVQGPKVDWESRVLKNWSFREMRDVKIKINLRSMARWDCPLQGWDKISFDEASKGNPRIGGCGIVIKNEQGYTIGVMAIPIGVQTNHIAEASATLYGLSLAKSLSLSKVWLEGDSLNIVNFFNKVATPSWTIQNIISKVLHIINSFKDCVITYNYRETNYVVDWAANVACKSQDKVIWISYDDIPIDGQFLMELDRLKSRKVSNNDDNAHEN